MLKSTLIALAASLVVFTISWHFIQIMTRSLGAPPGWPSRYELGILHYSVDFYHDNEGSLPRQEYLNQIIVDHYQLEPDHYKIKELSDKEPLLSQIIENILKKRDLRKWGSPPIYVKDEKLPQGYGFYLAGEDGISTSNGKDPDDINSWDKQSYRFYSQRLYRKEASQRTSISIIPALFTFIYIITRKKKTFSSRRESKA